MIDFKTTAIGFALAFALSGAVSPALAKDFAAPRAPRAGFDARAEAIGEAVSDRTEAIRACNQQADKLVEYSWGNESSDRYRACMAERGQAE